MNRQTQTSRSSHAAFLADQGLCGDHLCKTFGDWVVFEDLSIAFPPGQVTVLLGRNGCGKSTLVNLLSGLMRCDRGQVRFSGQPIEQARIGYVFQNYQASLFPWLTALENLQYPLRLQKLSVTDQRSRLYEFMQNHDVEFDGVKFDLHRYPYQLSGGQQQLLTILRSVIGLPDLLFLDEPFSALDCETRFYMRDRLQCICSNLKLTTIIVSHNLDDAIYLADRILMLDAAPMTVIADIPVALDRPRSADLLCHPAFIQIKQHCLQILQERPSP